MEKVAELLQKALANADFKSAFVSIERLPELQRDLERMLDEGTLNREFYDEIKARLGLNWHFSPPANVGQVRSVIITAVPQPKTSLEFMVNGKKHYAIVPPTYVYDTDKVAVDIMSSVLAEHGHRLHDALLPTKLLAVRSGLAHYGRNNISYIDGWGSYFRLRAFFSDMPCPEHYWQEPSALEICYRCTACIKKCPTNAISADRFLIDAGKCLTFFNEGEKEFPEWIHTQWHNCLVGCMVCQDVCPANKEHVAWVMPGGDFSEEETGMILGSVSKEKISPITAEKLRKAGMLDYYDLLKRNLAVLVDKDNDTEKED